MLRRRLPLTAIASSVLIAGGLFMLDLPQSQTSEVNRKIFGTQISAPLSVAPDMSVGSSAQAAIEIGPASSPREEIPESYTNTLEVGNGDTLMNLLLTAGINRGDAHTAIEALREAYDPRRLRPGQEIDVTFQPGRHDDEPHVFQAMALNTDFNKSIIVKRGEQGTYKAIEETQDLIKTLHRSQGAIDSSLYVAAVDAGIPAALLMEFIFAYSFDVDFQRDIQKGDTFEVMYEKISTDDGERSKVGKIQYASLTLSGLEYKIYRYQYEDGRVGYFNEKGQGAQKALMRTPINGARLSSGFGKRRHPILGYSKMHAGVDFAAPTGTPIYAAGDGVIDYIGRKGGYGKYIRIRHNSEFKTAYAHMHNFKRGMTRGKRVSQGDVIGYVGSTGRSTGPHLHYEIIRNGNKINPMRVRLPSGKTLEGKELARFKKIKAAHDQNFASLAPSKALDQLASAE